MVAIMLNGIPELQLSWGERIERLRALLAARLHQGCAITATDEAIFGPQCRIQHAGTGIEIVYRTDHPDLADTDWDPG
jgi:hypothetical protein